MEQYIWIPGELPSLNDLLDAKRLRRGKNGDGYSLMKKACEERVAIHARRCRSAHFRCPTMTYLFVESSQRRDPSNIASAAIKFIEDALVKLDVLETDGWKGIAGIGYWWHNHPRSGVLVHMIESVTGFGSPQSYETMLRIYSGLRSQ